MSNSQLSYPLHRCLTCRAKWWFPAMVFTVDGEAGSWSYAEMDGSRCQQCGTVCTPDLPTHPIKGMRYARRWMERAKARARREDARKAAAEKDSKAPRNVRRRAAKKKRRRMKTRSAVAGSARTTTDGSSR